MPKYFYEDFHIGQEIVCAPQTVTREDIVAFASEFDPQAFHVDEEEAKKTFFRGLVASGWHTASLTMRAMADRFILDTASMGSSGVDELRWLRPVRAGDIITAHAKALDARLSRSRPDMGLVRFLVEVKNQHGDIVMTQDNWMMLGRRHPGS